MRAKRDEFHPDLSSAHSENANTRNSVHTKHQESSEVREQVDNLKKENDDTRDHYNQINDIANQHISDLEQQIVDCQHKNQIKQSEISKLL